MLTGKKGIIFGIANDHSIAWGIGKKLRENGAALAITYQNEKLLKKTVFGVGHMLINYGLVMCNV